MIFKCETHSGACSEFYSQLYELVCSTPNYIDKRNVLLMKDNYIEKKKLSDKFK